MRTPSNTPLTRVPGISFFPNNIEPNFFAPNPDLYPGPNQIIPSSSLVTAPAPVDSPVSRISPYYLNTYTGQPTSVYLPSSRISPDSYRTNPLGEPIFTNMPTLVEVKAIIIHILDFATLVFVKYNLVFALTDLMLYNA